MAFEADMIDDIARALKTARQMRIALEIEALRVRSGASQA